MSEEHSNQTDAQAEDALSLGEQQLPVIEEHEESNPFEARTPLKGFQEAVEKVKNEIGLVIVGQENMVELMLAAMLADGHILIEGVPGVAKTLASKLLARTLEIPFSRIQFTPDLMP
ncbi:MAG: MoxR family ATPase, partial [Bacteroidota bacterium]